jgi:hypothetical protein
MKIKSVKLLLWEIGCVIWASAAGWILHFAFELSGYKKPMALFAAVNESAWEHTKLYFWPGLAYMLVQYTYTRDVAHNYWLGKALALAVTPISIFIVYFSYFAWVNATGAEATLAAMLTIMGAGIVIGQSVSYRVLTMPPIKLAQGPVPAALLAALVAMFSTFTYFPPHVRLFENFYCYTYTGDYGFLPDYEPYRVFLKKDDPRAKAGGGVNYCKAVYAKRRTGKN